jgi:hypothetical protein
MRTLLSKCAPGYPVSGGSGAFTAERIADHAARVQWKQRGLNATAMRVQTAVTDVPGSMSALSFVRRA